MAIVELLGSEYQPAKKDEKGKKKGEAAPKAKGGRGQGGRGLEGQEARHQGPGKSKAAKGSKTESKKASAE
jgi:hypothetical protein